MSQIIGGSFAVKYHGIDTQIADIDILSTGGDDVKDEKDVIKCDSNKLILKLPHSKIIIPDLITMTLIYKSHIHRIIRHGNHQSSVMKWFSQIRRYGQLLKKAGKTNILKILYGKGEHYVDAIATDKQYYEDEPLDYLIYRKFYIARFNEANEKWGDAIVEMKKTNEEFFNDNVLRFVDHDEVIHRKIADWKRGTKSELPFECFKEDSKMAELSSKLFFLDENEDKRISCVREEIMALFIERKLLPALVKFGKIPMGLEEQLFEITSHHITNLCGTGHYWLRQWCLDNFEKFDPLRHSYDIDGMIKITKDIVDEHKLTSKTVESKDETTESKNNDSNSDDEKVESKDINSNSDDDSEWDIRPIYLLKSGRYTKNKPKLTDEVRTTYFVRHDYDDDYIGWFDETPEEPERCYDSSCSSYGSWGDVRYKSDGYLQDYSREGTFKFRVWKHDGYVENKDNIETSEKYVLDATYYYSYGGCGTQRGGTYTHVSSYGDYEESVDNLLKKILHYKGSIEDCCNSESSDSE